MRETRTNHAHLQTVTRSHRLQVIDLMAGSTGLEPATSGLTVQCANQAAPRARVHSRRRQLAPGPITLPWASVRVNAGG
jgi:hypothetical protein